MEIYDQIKKNFFFIAGPCVIENEKMVMKTASSLLQITQKLKIPFIFKASYDKANRTSVKSFRGPGLEKGLEILAAVKDKFNIPVLTDVHSPEEAEIAAEVVDILQIPAFLCRQTDLILSAGRTGKCVNVKKAQFLAPENMKYIIEKLESVSCRKILITERGSSFGYGNLVVDFLGIPIMKKLNYPIFLDATHSVQRPVAGSNKTQGFREGIKPLLFAAAAAGVDGIFMEVHPQPQKALSDRETQFPLNEVEQTLRKIMKIRQALK